MPFKSEKQRRFLYATNKKLATQIEDDAEKKGRGKKVVKAAHKKRKHHALRAMKKGS